MIDEQQVNKGISQSGKQNDDAVRPMTVVFVNYGDFNNNSGGHIAHFANCLVSLGAEVYVVADGSAQAAEDFGVVLFRCLNFSSVWQETPAELLSVLRGPRAIVHAWTPREKVRKLVEKLHSETQCQFIIHLEDNEELVTSQTLGVSWVELGSKRLSYLDDAISPHLSHPIKYRMFLDNSSGVTVITKSLSYFVPAQKDWITLEPGVDTEFFKPSNSDSKRRKDRKNLYIDDLDWVIVYHGNMHGSNRRDIFSLYTAVLILRRRKRRVILIRCGLDYVDGIDLSFDYLKKEVAIDLRRVDRNDLPSLLDLADCFVQPGGNDEFNRYRFPSKIPEFLSMGRPTLLPNTNIGLQLNNMENAVLLEKGDALDIADKLEVLISDKERAQSIGSAGRHFAQRSFDWMRNSRALLSFYESRLRDFVSVATNEIEL